MDEVECVVIGAGVVGLATARALALSGRDVLVLEAERTIGTGTSSRNSEVIHAGIYYPPGSLKARLCVEGRHLLYDYLAQRHLPHRRCGKLIVATSAAQVPQLAAIRAQAEANGVHDLQWLSGDQAKLMEPALRCEAALLSPSTGILDSHALMLALQGDLEAAGGMVAFVSPVRRAECTPTGMVLHAADGTRLKSRIVVNAAGLAAPQLARSFEGLAPACVPPAYFAKGSYFTLTGRAPFGHLIYPVPEAAGLGIHLTLDLAGQARFGPDVEWVGSPHDLRVDPQRAAQFERAVRTYWPGLPRDALQPGYAGIRPKISGPGEAAADFMVVGPEQHGVPGLVHLFGIESPGLTSCLAIAQLVVNKLSLAGAGM